MRLVFELVGVCMVAYVLYLGLNAWAKARQKIADDRRELEAFRNADKKG